MAARWTILLATSKRTFGSVLMPVSSLEIAITAHLYSATSGKTASMRSCSPVTELISGLPPAAFKPARSAATIDESTLSGTSTTDCTASMAATITSGSSSWALATPNPALTSSTGAPAAIWASASVFTRS